MHITVRRYIRHTRASVVNKCTTLRPTLEQVKYNIYFIVHAISIIYDINIVTPLCKFNEPTEPPAADWLAKLHSSMIHSYYYYYNAWFPLLPPYKNRWIDDDAATAVFLVAGGSCSTTKRRSLIILNIVQQSGLFIIYFYFMSVTI